LLLLTTACGGGQPGTDSTGAQASDSGTRKTALAAAPISWTRCAGEGGFCAFSGTRLVRYGTDTQTATLSLTDGTACSNSVFGDPAPWQSKSCSVADDSSQLAATSTGSSTWVSCGNEGQTCAFTGTHAVRYGTASQFVTLSFSGGVSCSNAVFGDPAVGIAKSCQYEQAASSTPPSTASSTASTSSSASTWIKCANEGQSCTFTGTRSVRYGVDTRLVTRSFTGSVSCSNDVFGDPAAGAGKSCWYEDVAAAAPAADAAVQWIACGSESQFCAFSGTRQVRYGTATAFNLGTYTDGVSCSNAVFGDPAVSYAKSCTYAAAAALALPPVTPSPASPDATGTSPPVVFNASANARPGDVVSLQGEGFGSTPKVYLDSAPDNALEIVNRVGTGWLAVQIPPTAGGALTLRINNGSGTSAQVKLNAARPLHLDALQLVPGGAFRVFGRNLLLPGATPVVTIEGTPAALDLARSNEHVLYATVPASLGARPKAAISVDNGNGSGAAALDRTIEIVASGTGDPFALGVGWGAGFSAISSRVVNAATDARLAAKVSCDGSSDDAWPIQTAIDLAAANGGGIVRLPAGTCRMAGGMALKSNVVVEGAGKDATRLRYESNYPVFGVGLDLAGLRNLTLENAGSSTEGPLLKDSTRVFLQNVRVRLGTSRQMYLSGNRNIVVAGSDFVQAGSISQQGPYVFSDCSGFVFEGNTTSFVGGAPAFGRIHDASIQGNRFSRDGSHQNDAGTVHSFTIDFAHRIAVIGNTFDVTGGPIKNKTRNDGETILSEGGGAARTENLGSVASATATTLGDPNNALNVDPFATGAIPENYGVAIVAGKGAGQTRRLVAYQGGTMTVDRAWDVVPDTSSRYASFVWGLEKTLIKGNTLSQNPRGIWLYHTAIREVDVVGNSISEGGGIYLRSYQNLSQKAFMPIYNVLIAKNRVVNTTGDWMSYINAVFVNADAKAFGIANLGIEIRGNDIVANRPNVSSSWEEYAGTEGFMAMMRIESASAYESSAVPRQLGSVFANNSCTHCDVAVRIGTGAGGTTLLNTQLIDGKALTEDWATTGGSEKSTATVVR
jgi:hypothetical protein